MSHRTRVAVGLALFAGSALSLAPTIAQASEPAQVTPAANAGTPLPTDTRPTRGELSNGLKYIVMKHATPPGKVAIYMHVSTGSLNETDKQRGIAHYLEHMAFNGSKNFKPGTVIDFFQSLGLKFGQHQNAFTSFNQTVYQLNMPENKVEMLDKALLFMSDVAGRLSLLPAEIDEERGIIMEEKRTRLNAQQRVSEYMLERIAPGSTFGFHLPIGTDQTLQSVMEPDFRDYYERYYVPSNMTLMIVGDMDEKTVVDRIQAAFSDLGGGKKTPVPQDRPANVKEATEHRAIVAVDKELTRAQVSIHRIAPPNAPTTTVEQARADLVERMAMAALNRRIDDKVSKGEMPFLSAGASADNAFGALRWTSIQATCESDKWQASLEAMSAEIARAGKYGFTADELDKVRKDFIADLEQSVAIEGTLPAEAWLGRWNSAIAEGEPIMSAQQVLDTLKPLAQTIKVEECNAAFAKAFRPNLVFMVSLPASVKAPTEAELIDLGVKSLAREVQNEVQQASAKQLLEKMPTPGTYAESATHEASGVWSGWLSNNVRVHHRFMDYEKNDATITINLYGGELLETAETRGRTIGTLVGWSRPATSTLSSIDIKDLMTGKKVGVSPAPSRDGIGLIVSGNPEDLESGMQLAHLLLTDAKIEKAAFDQTKTLISQTIAQQEKNPQSYFSRLMARTMYPVADLRTQPLTQEQVQGLNLEQCQAWLTKLASESPIEVSVVGDISREKALELVAKYLGSLSNRPRVTKDMMSSLKNVARPEGDRTASVDFETQTPQARVLAGFYGPDDKDLMLLRKMRLAEQILSSRMINQIREKDQFVYSIRASYNPNASFPELSFFGVGFPSGLPTDTPKVEPLVARVHEMLAAFAKDGPTDEEMGVARKQIVNDLVENMKKPGWWQSNLAQLTYRDRSLDDVLKSAQAYDSISAADVKEAFATYYDKPGNKVSISLKPKAQAAAEEKK